RETISDRVIRADQTKLSRAAALVVSNYSGLDGSRAIRTDLPRTFPAEMTEVETHYFVDGGYITCVQRLEGASRFRLEEQQFLPQYLRPDRTWSNTLAPFEYSSDDILTVMQHHRTFLEWHDIVVPAGRFVAIRVETEAVYQSRAGSSGKRYFTDWYAAD